MKSLILSTIFAVALLNFVSCNKQYDTTVSDSQDTTTTNNNNGSNSDFNWSGTAPLSAKVDGMPFLADTATVTNAFGYYFISGKGADGSSITPSIPVGAVEGQIYSLPSPANVSWQSSSLSTVALSASQGKCKIITNNATTIEGYFWADEKDLSGLTDTIVYITEGYFKVDKP